MVHIALGVYASMVIPMWESYDEIGHYRLADYLATEHKSPPWGTTLVSENDESNQPVLYHVLAAAPLALANVPNDLQPRLNPYFHEPSGQGGYNRVVHDWAAEAFPYRGTALAVHLARWVSVLIGGMCLIVTWVLARTLCPDRAWVWRGAVLINMFWPQFRYETAVINNDILVTACGGVIALLVARLFVKPKASLLDIVSPWLALLVSVFVKANALALAPVVVVATLAYPFHAPRSERKRVLVWFAAIVMALSVGVARWWDISTSVSQTRLPGGIHGLQHIRALVESRLIPNRFGLGLLDEVSKSGLVGFWASYGWGNIGLPRPYYWGAGLWGLVGVADVLVWARRGQRRPGLAAVVFLSLLVASGVAMPIVLYASLGRTWVPGRYMLPVLPALSVLLSLGFNTLVPGRLRPWAWSITAGLSLIFALLVPLLVIHPAYADPQLIDEARLQDYSTVHYDFGFVELLGYRIDTERLDPVDTLRATLIWRVSAQTSQEHAMTARLVDPEGNEIGALRRFPGRGAVATTDWTPGALFAEDVELHIHSERSQSFVTSLEVGFHECLDPDRAVVARDEGGEPVPVSLGRVEVRGASVR